MNILDKLNQKCCYWAAPVADGYGKFTYAAVVEIDCRWNNKAMRYINKEGEQKVTTAVVIVNQDLVLGGFLWLGAEADLPSPHTDPTTVSGAYAIGFFSKVVSLDGIDVVRKAYL